MNHRISTNGDIGLSFVDRYEDLKNRKARILLRESGRVKRVVYNRRTWLGVRMQRWSRRVVRSAQILVLAVVTPGMARPADEVLWISDIHFGPMADVALVSELEKTEPAQWGAI
jgi:hypothetical protein